MGPTATAVRVCFTDRSQRLILRNTSINENKPSLRSIHLYSPLLAGGQFPDVYLIAQAQTAVPRIFALLTNLTYQFLIYDYYSVV